jgi:serine-type D-Ala-D-Ala endopeptidase (penicillin-binding protein 7)
MTNRPFSSFFPVLVTAFAGMRCSAAAQPQVVPAMPGPSMRLSYSDAARAPRRWMPFGLVTLLLGLVAAHFGMSHAHASPSGRQASPAGTATNAILTTNPVLGSAAFVVASQTTGEILIERGANASMPIASITKLMTAMVVLDAGQSLSEMLTITADDIDRLKGTGSRLGVGTRLSREEMLNLALMSSENRAASALARHYPGGAKGFIEAMNVKARMVGLSDTRFADSTGLDPKNVSSPRDLVRLVSAASTYPLIREFSTTSERHVRVGNRSERFGNSNALVRDPDWQVGVSKTGYIREAGRCLVMQTWVHGEPVIIVLLNSEGRYTRTADAKRVKQWLEASGGQRVAALISAGRGS